MADTVRDADKVAAAAKWIEEADAVLVCAGAGMSAVAGEAVYVDEADFAAHYPWMARHGYRTAYQCMRMGSDDRMPARAKWGQWASHYLNLRFRFGRHDGYASLRRLIGGRDHFVLTSNVDGAFERGGFDASRVYTPQGDAAFYQCRNAGGPCARDAVFEAKEMYEELVAGRDEGGAAARAPPCPRCGGPDTFANLRGGSWFLHHRYDAQNAALVAWVERQLAHGQQRRKIVVVEVGAGFNTPTVTRFPAEATVRDFGPARAALVRINPSDHGVPTDLPRAVGIAQGWGVLGEIEQQLGLGGREGVGGPGSAAGSSTADARAASEARLLAAERPADECEPAVCCDWRQFLTSLRSSQA